MQASPAHRLILKWAILTGAIALGVLVLWTEGAIALVLEHDRSRISIGIGIAFALACLHVAACVFRLSGEIEAGRALAGRLDARDRPALAVADDGRLLVAGEAVSEGIQARHLARLLDTARDDAAGLAPGAAESLLGALERRLRGRYEIGWMLADLMFKLGLLGTVVGFILMLGSVTTIETFDLAAMQSVLVRMSDGMRVALFTTVTGLVAGVALGAQYHLVDRGAELLLAELGELTVIALHRRPPPATPR